jgi:hypothetical protein
MIQTNLRGEAIPNNTQPKVLHSSTRKKLVEKAIHFYGGKATLHQISDYLDLHPNGISQTLSSMPNSRSQYDAKLKKLVYSLE